MTNNEKILFFELSNFINPNQKLISNLLPDCATSNVLGKLFFNRIQAVAFGTLKGCNLLGSVNREFKNSLGAAYEQNILKNESFFKCIDIVTNILNSKDTNYALLKGAILCKMYPKGYRTSNDIDVLTIPDEVGKISNLLLQAGFKQGHIRNGEFEAAGRQEIFNSLLTRGETVPFILKVNLPQMKYLEVDINFSLDYKNGNEKMLKNILENTKTYNFESQVITSLSEIDFFIHLCSHLYKEATTLPWVKMNRDMTLYKYLDIYYCLNGFTEDTTYSIFNRACELGLSEICAVVITWVNELWPLNNLSAIDNALAVLADNTALHDTVLSPSEKKTYIYTDTNLKNRFFFDNRISLLKEI